MKHHGEVFDVFNAGWWPKVIAMDLMNPIISNYHENTILFEESTLERVTYLSNTVSLKLYSSRLVIIHGTNGNVILTVPVNDIVGCIYSKSIIKDNIFDFNIFSLEL